MIYVLYIFTGLLVIQGIFSLIEGIRFRSFVRRSLQSPPRGFKPRAAIIAPCKGVDAGLEENLRELFHQDYPDYRIIFAVSSNDDPARQVIERVIAEHPETDACLVVSSPSSERSEKIGNLICGLDQAGEDCRVLVFVDSDARVTSGWHDSLVSPLGDKRAGATNG